MDNLERSKTPGGYYKVGMVFLEWTQIKKTADLTAYQALLYGSLRIMESMAADFGYPQKEQFQKRAEELQKVILNQFWDEQKACFFDGFENGNKIDHYYPISNYYPLLFQVVTDKEQKEKMIRFLDQELKDIGEESGNQKTTPYGAFYLFASLYENGAAGLAERFLKQYWTRMIIPDDDTSWEYFITKEDGTASHAWSGHPTFFLSTEVLGVQLGFNKQFSRDTIYIQPQSETLSWAKGTVPHPAGLVGVEWHISGDFLLLNLTIPANVPYIIEPRGRLARYKLITAIKYSLKD
jgi:alpha-L-rhamnosidase